MKVKVPKRMNSTTSIRGAIAPAEDITLRCDHSTSHFIPAPRPAWRAGPPRRRNEIQPAISNIDYLCICCASTVLVMGVELWSCFGWQTHMPSKVHWTCHTCALCIYSLALGAVVWFGFFLLWLACFCFIVIFGLADKCGRRCFIGRFGSVLLL